MSLSLAVRTHPWGCLDGCSVNTGGYNILGKYSRRDPNQNEFKQYIFNMPVSTFSKGKLYTTPKMTELPKKKAGNDFTNSTDAINPSVLKTLALGGRATS